MIHTIYNRRIILFSCLRVYYTENSLPKLEIMVEKRFLRALMKRCIIQYNTRLHPMNSKPIYCRLLFYKEKLPMSFPSNVNIFRFISIRIAMCNQMSC